MGFIRQRLPELGEGDEYELRAGDPLYNVGDPKEAQIVGWRVDCFERLGFAHTAALALAMRRDVDRSQVENLVAKGAAHAQVMGILL